MDTIFDVCFVCWAPKEKHNSKVMITYQCFSVAILDAIFDVCVVCWRAPKEKHNSKEMIT